RRPRVHHRAGLAAQQPNERGRGTLQQGEWLGGGDFGSPACRRFRVASQRILSKRGGSGSQQARAIGALVQQRGGG
ncbi:MAG: hypothetical protein ACK4ZJ_18880, partial [Allorhizobium sp.]